MTTMDLPISQHEINAGHFSCGWWCLKDLPAKSWAKAIEVVRKITKIGKDDPRRIMHSLKVGLALTLVSLLYYSEPLYASFGVNAIWALLTVVVVFEFSVGATLGKGLNRMLATLIAGFLGFGVHCLAILSGRTAEAIIIGFFVFLIAAIMTFARFFPRLKARFDYGLIIFILTFCLVSVSGYREDELLKMARDRISTVLVGCCTVIIICICICPVWTGEDLHNLVAGNIEKLGDFLEGFVGAYFSMSGEERTNVNMSALQGYKNVLSSKLSEENMANLARWEPGHGRFVWYHPWNQYLKIGTLTRECAYKVEALSSYLNSENLSSEIQTPLEIRSKIQEWCTIICSETGKALKESASSMHMMTKTDFSDLHITVSKAAAGNLKFLLETSLWAEWHLMQIIQPASVALLLMEVVECTQKIVEAVHELASLARFKAMGQNHGAGQPIPDIEAESHNFTTGTE